MTEGTTRLLETPERPASFDQHVYEQPGQLAQATSRVPSQAYETSRSLQTKSKSPKGVLVGSLLLIAFLLTTLFIVVAKRSAKKTVISPPAVTRPEMPPVPPPPPLPPRGSAEGTSFNRALIYPGAKTIMDVTGEDEDHVLQLRTSDSIDKVADWYIEKLKPAHVTRMKEPTSQVILEADETNVVINENGDGTTITLTQEDD